MTTERIARQCICCASTDLDRSPAVLMPFVAKRVFGHEPVQITAEWGLRDLQPGMAYTLCTSLQCKQCGVLFLDYRFSDTELAQLYRGYRDEHYTRERDFYEPGYAKTSEHYHGRAAYIADVERWLAPQVPDLPAVLDWGGDSGINTPFLGRSTLTHVYDISTVQPIEGVVALERSAIGEHRYDLVTCSQVLEHVPDPRALLGQIGQSLSDDTLLYLEVPNEALMREHPGSRQLAPLKRHWHEHINFFTPDSLRQLVEGTGLQVQAVLDLSIDLGWRKASVLGMTVRRAAA